MATTQYTFETAAYHDPHPPKKRHHRRSNSEEDDGNGSLTYSANSSTYSATGESTDSSFADIMRVLDMQESNGVTQYLKRTDKSVAADSLAYSTNADSLAYSTDAESHIRTMYTENSGLHGTDLLSTITGQPSDQAHDQVERQDDLDILFSPAEHADSLKRRKERKKRERLQQRQQILNNRNALKKNEMTVSTTASRTTKPESNEVKMDEEDEVWYAKWWMPCIPDTIKIVQQIASSMIR